MKDCPQCKSPYGYPLGELFACPKCGHEWNPNTITGKIYLKIFELLKAHPEGIQWTHLNKMIEEAYPNFHPKTINGCVWKLTEKFPEQVIKPAKGLFKFVGHNFNT